MAINVFVPLQKADMTKRQVWGMAAVEQLDSGRPPEIMDYQRSKPHFLKWSEEVQRISGGKSLGNVRAMHGGQMRAVGRVIHFEPRDVNKSFYVGVEVVDDAAWEKVAKGVYTGFSIGGRYGERWPDEIEKTATRYEAIPSEISLVDIPCIPNATFEFIKANGNTEMRKFAQKETDMTTEENNQPESENEEPAAEASSESETAPESAPEDGKSSSGAEGSAPEGPQDGPKEQAGLDAEAVKSVVISLLIDLGLVQESSTQPTNMSMALRLDDLKKGITSREKGLLKIQQTELQKALDSQKTSMEGQVADLRKTLASDIAQVVLAVEKLEKRGGPGPVVRDLGVISPQAMAEMQKAAVLKDMLPNADPLTRQKLEAEITRLEIKAAQTQQIIP